MLAHKISIPGVGPGVNNLLLWRDPKKSGLVFAALTGVYVFFSLSALGPLPLLLRSLAYASVIAVGWQYAGTFFGRSGPPVPPVLESGFSEDSFRQLASSIRPHVNAVLSQLGIVISGKYPKISLQVFAVAFVASYILALVPFLGLTYTVVLLAFTLPKLYELRKDEADKYLTQAIDKFHEVYKKVEEAIHKKLPRNAPTVKKDL